MYCLTCKKTTFVLHGTNNICGVCGKKEFNATPESIWGIITGEKFEKLTNEKSNFWDLNKIDQIEILEKLFNTL